MKRTATIALSAIFLLVTTELAFGATSAELRRWEVSETVELQRDGYDCMIKGYSCNSDNLNWILTDPSECSSYMNLLRARSEYIGEDADYIYMKASIGNTVNYSLVLDPLGTHQFGVPKDILEAWIADNCRLITP